MMRNFEGDMLNVIPTDPVPETVFLPWIPDVDNYELSVLNYKVSNPEIKLYFDMKKDKLLSEKYWNKYKVTLANAINNYGVTIGQVDTLGVNYEGVTVIFDNCCGQVNKFESILKSCTMFAIPVIQESKYTCTIGKDAYGGHTKKIINHIALCIGKAKDKYLFI